MSKLSLNKLSVNEFSKQTNMFIGHVDPMELSYIMKIKRFLANLTGTLLTIHSLMSRLQSVDRLDHLWLHKSMY